MGLADVARRTAHAGVARILAANTTSDGDVFLMMESLSGETLDAAWRGHERQRLSGGARSLAPTQPTMHIERALPVFARVLDCLAAAHDGAVLHRGLKPSNVFLTEGDAIKLLDFGVAEVRDAIPARTPTSACLGTPAYMAPEQAMSLVDQLDGRADLFAVGAMMHALITGHEINDAGTETESLVMAATRPVPSVSLIARACRRHTRDLCELKRERRHRRGGRVLPWRRPPLRGRLSSCPPPSQAEREGKT